MRSRKRKRKEPPAPAADRPIGIFLERGAYAEAEGVTGGFDELIRLQQDASARVSGVDHDPRRGNFVHVRELRTGKFAKNPPKH